MTRKYHRDGMAWYLLARILFVIAVTYAAALIRPFGLQLIAFELEANALGDRRPLRALGPFHFELALVNGNGYALRNRDYFLSNTGHSF